MRDCDRAPFDDCRFQIRLQDFIVAVGFSSRAKLEEIFPWFQGLLWRCQMRQLSETGGGMSNVSSDELGHDPGSVLGALRPRKAPTEFPELRNFVYTILYYTILYHTIPYYTILYTRILSPIARCEGSFAVLHLRVLFQT